MNKDQMKKLEKLNEPDQHSERLMIQKERIGRELMSKDTKNVRCSHNSHSQGGKHSLVILVPHITYKEDLL